VLQDDHPSRGRLRPRSCPGQVFLAPVFSLVFAIVAGIPPHMREAGQRRLHGRGRQQQPHSITIHHMRRMPLHFAPQPLRAHEAMPLTAFALLRPLIPSLTADPGRLHTLAVDETSTGLCMAARGNSALCSERLGPLCPGTIFAPGAKVVRGRLPGGKPLGQQPPLTPRSDHVEDRVENFPQRVFLRTPGLVNTREE
jgi:hypothetical protein